MSKSKTALESVILLGIAVLFTLIGASIPVHFRAVSLRSLSEIGTGTDSLAAISDDLLTGGKIGPVEIIQKAVPELGTMEDFESRRGKILERKPEYAFSGGPDPYFDSFLSLIDWGPEAGNLDKAGFAITLFLPPANRRELTELLNNSSNALVHSLLETRNITQTTKLLPASSPAGHPMDASILMTALLAQGEHFRPSFSRGLRNTVQSANATFPPAIDRLEDVYLSVIALGMRFNWVQMLTLVRNCEDLDTLIRLGGFFRKEPEKLPGFYSFVVLCEDPKGLFSYMDRYPDTGWDDLLTTRAINRGTMQELIKRGKPIYAPPGWIVSCERAIAYVASPGFIQFSVKHPYFSIFFKGFLLFTAGYFISLLLCLLVDLYLSRPSVRAGPIPRTNRLIILANSFFAALVSTLLWIFMEPKLLQFAPKEKAELRLVFDLIEKLDFLDTVNIKKTAMLDQVTIITLLVFFLLQVTVYIFCLIKVAEIKNKKNTPGVKMKLLENEENLFDLGLYVGLGGTVTSLIMLALEVKEASLIAAYSSTLFGIIFVAVLKVFHVRPFRKNLIMQCEYFSYEQDAPTDNL